MASSSDILRMLCQVVLSVLTDNESFLQAVDSSHCQSLVAEHCRKRLGETRKKARCSRESDLSESDDTDERRQHVTRILHPAFPFKYFDPGGLHINSARDALTVQYKEG